jgi:hypothetical protein
MAPEVFWTLTSIAEAAVIALLCAYIKRVTDERADLKTRLDAFDHDGDGRPGGSKRRAF